MNHDRLTRSPVSELSRSNELPTNNLLPPLRRIPLELWQEIFLHYHYMFDRSTEPTVHQEHTRFPWAISHVCFAWRSAVLSLPILWSQILDIKLDSVLRRPQCSRLEWILERSKPALLTLSVAGSVRASSEKGHPIIDLLVSHSERWESFSIGACTVTLLAFSSIENRLPQLRNLKVGVDYGSSPPPNPTIRFFENAPNLRTFDFHDMDYDETVTIITVPWPQLTSYRQVVRLGCSTLNLEQAHNLQRLDTFWDSNMSLEHADVQLDNLKSFRFEVGCIDTAPAHNFIDSLTLPALQDLTIPEYADEILPSVISLFRRSSSTSIPYPLRTLDLRCSHFNEEGDNMNLINLTKMFVLTPLLEELRIRLEGNADALQCLTYAQRGGYLLPQLQVLIVHTGVVELDVFARIAETRWNSNPSTQNTPLPVSPFTLRTLRINFSRSQALFLAHGLLNAPDVPDTSSNPEPEEDPVLLNNLRDFTSALYQTETLRSRGSVLNEILKKLENIQPTYVLGMYTWIYFHNIRELVASNNISSVEDALFSICTRVGTLIEKWRPGLHEYASSMYWVQEGLYDLLYLPPFCESRLPGSKDYLGDLALGLPARQEPTIPFP